MSPRPICSSSHNNTEHEHDTAVHGDPSPQLSDAPHASQRAWIQDCKGSEANHGTDEEPAKDTRDDFENDDGRDECERDYDNGSLQSLPFERSGNTV